MNTPIAIKIECAKGEIMNAMQQIQAPMHHRRGYFLRTGGGEGGI